MEHMVEIRRLIEYNQTIRRQYFEAISKVPWDELTRDRGASFGSIRNIFVHTLNSVTHWLEFLQGDPSYQRKSFDDYHSIKDLEDYMREVEQRIHTYLCSLTPPMLQAEYEVIVGEHHENTDVTAEDILVHIFEEEVHHRGELIALLWQIGVKPPPMGWKQL
jgi:uncharacterized damage-inducible protein DinB